MVKTSAGLLMYKIKNKNLEVFLIHPGGPFWEHKDEGVWGIPKGEQDDDNHDLLDVAKREFEEETGIDVPKNTEFITLGFIKQKNNKIVHAWAFENTFPFKFECKSHVKMKKASSLSSDNESQDDKIIEFCEADDGRFFNILEAREKILEAQFELIERLMKELNIFVQKDKAIKQTKLF